MIFVLGIGIITIMQAVTRTTNYISETAQRTIALNLAKEGIEAVYNIRNTNWHRRSSQRNQCWLKANPMVDTGNDGCQNDEWMREGRYVISVEMLPGTSEKYYRIYPRESYDALVPTNHFPKNKRWNQHYGWWDLWIYGQDFIQWDYAPIRRDKVSGSVLFYQGRAITAAEYMDLGLKEEDLDHRYGKYWRNIAVF